MEKRKPIKILHVDDEGSHLEFTKIFLEELDEEVVVDSATNPMEALGLQEKNSYDCIVSDYKMLSMDGIELAQRVRERSSVPFILYTGQGSEEVAEQAFEAGIDDYIRKEPEPAHYRVLAKRIRSAVDKHRAESHLQTSEENYRNVVELASQGIIVVQDGLLRFVNPRVTEMTGYATEELLEKPFIDYLHPEDRHEALETYRNRDPSGTTFYPFRIITKNGDVLWIEVNGVGIDWDGSEATLLDVVEYYDRGGNPNPWLDGGIRPLSLSDREKADLVELMKTFTSEDLDRFEELGKLMP